MRVILAVLLVTLCSPSLCQLWPGGVPYLGGPPPLAVLAEHPLSVADTLARVPLILVPRRQLTMLNNVHISSVSPTEPLVTCKLPKQTLDATPAVRVVLERPLVLSSPEALVGFPSQVSVVHEGLRISVPVGALLAPVQEPQVLGPHVVRVIYAIPTTPLFLRYPFYPPVPYPFRPAGTGLLGGSELGAQVVDKKPSQAYTRPLVTVLDFPTELASPQSLFYQPPIESELGNRGPPEAVIPAGIVQSAQPRPFVTPFFNSKESPLLQAFRDEAEKNKDDPDSTGVEAL